jgi:hypothetical protein
VILTDKSTQLSLESLVHHQEVVVVPFHYSPYVGLGIPKVSWSVSVHSVVSDQLTDRTRFLLIPDVTARA